MSNKIFRCVSIRQIGSRNAYLATLASLSTKRLSNIRFEGFTRQEVISRLRRQYGCIVPSNVANPPNGKSNTCSTPNYSLDL